MGQMPPQKHHLKGGVSRHADCRFSRHFHGADNVRGAADEARGSSSKTLKTH